MQNNQPITTSKHNKFDFFLHFAGFVTRTAMDEREMKRNKIKTKANERNMKGTNDFEKERTKSIEFERVRRVQPSQRISHCLIGYLAN